MTIFAYTLQKAILNKAMTIYMYEWATAGENTPSDMYYQTLDWLQSP